MSYQSNEALLKDTLPFWETLSEKDQALLLTGSRNVRYTAGESIRSADRSCIGLILVKSGELRSYILSDDGREITLFRIGEGELCILSASCILKNITFEVHISAQKETDALIINAAVFSELMRTNTAVENFALKSAVDRFSDVMWAMEQLLFMSFDRRLATFLLDETAKTQIDTLSMTHEEVASYIGSAREVVSRMLKYFEKENMIELGRKSITITDRNKLKTLI